VVIVVPTVSHAILALADQLRPGALAPSPN